MAFDEDDAHAEEFTTMEITTLRTWNALQDAGFKTHADVVLRAGLQLEHYTSKLAADPAKRSLSQIAHQAVLRDRLNDALDIARQLLAQPPTRTIEIPPIRPYRSPFEPGG